MKTGFFACTIALGFMTQFAQAGAIDTFRQICVSNAGNPSAIIAAGNKAGFGMEKMAVGAIGFRTKTDESLQVNVATKHKFECAVTTSDMANFEQVRADFFKSLGLKPKRGTARGIIGGKTYTFLHDTRGGEAFVMFSN
ncbi:hypothetical protein C8N32_109129 [Rhodovulum imhoffii]|uniref:Uncharacterized protein n=1 Tax=Rhodovulum imhoffii TaxID=365340 RepID=A0A2T5BRU2_9RHOB|nr:hypothetical protein [Rhodovulum imhoffii]MBK5933270.1 hypothetical protein [Rhodovulum imhoffii]PTN02005.1 hypothetical protein C8N32_109129 [Rhodovulum imhoffii]